LRKLYATSLNIYTENFADETQDKWMGIGTFRCSSKLCHLTALQLFIRRHNKDRL